MSEYWKSVPRKFCDFCKCWITDNKPSVDFHERGKRHIEAVERRLKDVRKKSYEKSIEDDLLAKQMEQMEKAALAAFKKDLAADPSLAKQYGVSLGPKPKPGGSSASAVSVSVSDQEKKDDQSQSKKKKEKCEVEWYESKSPEGYSYYWSTISGESRWEAPEKFVSVEEQEERKAEEEKERKEKKKLKKTKVKVDKIKEEEEIESTATETKTETSEKCSAEGVLESFNSNSNTNSDRQSRLHADPTFSRSAFGAWSVVKEESQPTVFEANSVAPLPTDIPLPTEFPLAVKKEEAKVFKEKTVKSLIPPSSSSNSSADAGIPTFKKRKITSGARNSRQKTGDE